MKRRTPEVYTQLYYKVKTAAGLEQRFVLPFSGGNTPRNVLRFYLRMRKVNAVPASLQHHVDGMLRMVAIGKDPRVVFQDAPKLGRGNRDQERAMLMCAEALRLEQEHQVERAESKRIVAAKFACDQKTVGRHIAKWEARFLECRSASLRCYIHNLNALHRGAHLNHNQNSRVIPLEDFLEEWNALHSACDTQDKENS